MAEFLRGRWCNATADPFGNHFRALRRTAELSQYELSLLCNMKQAHISEIEHGHLRIGPARAARIAPHLNVPAEEITYQLWKEKMLENKEEE